MLASTVSVLLGVVLGVVLGGGWSVGLVLVWSGLSCLSVLSLAVTVACSGHPLVPVRGRLHALCKTLGVTMMLMMMMTREIRALMPLHVIATVACQYSVGSLGFLWGALPSYKGEMLPVFA